MGALHDWARENYKTHEQILKAVKELVKVFEENPILLRKLRDVARRK